MAQKLFPPAFSALARLTVVAVVVVLTNTALAAPAAGQDAGVGAETGVRRLLTALAHDSLRGRRTGSEGARAAARLLARELERYGVDPAGDEGYFQFVPLARTGGDSRPRLALASEAPGADTLTGINVVGLVRGTDEDLSRQAVVVGAHYDHLGVGDPVAGDSVYNGADDDASGVVAVLEAARRLAGSRPDRSVVFLLSTGEEQGLLGTRWYLEHPVVPLERTVADLQVEMIGRPDSLAGGPGRLWLTGYERSTVGPSLADRGLPVVPDPRPEQRFFFRSDNIAFARRGIPAHTVSSYGMHADYHRPSDETERVDHAHLVRAVDAVARAVRVLANGAAPEWVEGGRPEGAGR